MPETASMDLKGFGPFEIKDETKGEVEAVVNTLGIVDRDRDVILHGAIADGAVVKMSAYGHDVVIGNAPPAGKGTISIDGDRVVFRGNFFMATTRGRDAFETVKALGSDGEWSIGFNNIKTAELTDEWKDQGARRLISSVDIVEVSPVFIGSNPRTATLAVKAAPSLTDRVESVHNALYARNEAQGDDESAVRWWAREVFEDHVIVSSTAGPLFRVAYTLDEDGTVTLGEAVEVEVEYSVVEKSAEVEVETPAETEDEIKAQTDATEAERLAAEIKAAAEGEFERFQRTLRRVA